MVRESAGDRIFHTCIVLFCGFAIVITLYPFVYVLSMYISNPRHVLDQSVWLYPKGLSVKAYRIVLSNPEIWRSYYNTVWYATVGTILNLILTITSAYALSRPKFFLRKHIMLFIAFTMFFSGGLIPLFIIVRKLGIYNTRLAMILPTAVSAWNLIIARTFLSTNVPETMHESAFMDGAGELQILVRIYLPLSKPIIAVLALYYAVGHWNAYFNALIFLPNRDLQPLQLYLVRILTQYSNELVGDINITIDRSAYGVQLKYAAIIFTILPIICVYPFLQKYFVKGVMIGALKG